MSSGHQLHTPAQNQRALYWSGGLTGFYFVVELAVGLWTGSVAVISDALHTFSAVGGILIALVAAYFARKPPSPQRTFGVYRAEILGAFSNGVLLFVMALLVLWMGYHRLLQPIHLPPLPMLLVAVGGIVTEVISLYLLWSGQRTSLNIRGAFWHVIQTSLAVLS